MKKNFITRALSKIALKMTPVSDDVLIKTGFQKDGIFYKMGDLVVRKIGIFFFFQNLDGHLEKINNAQELSDLVYGNTPYLR